MGSNPKSIEFKEVISNKIKGYCGGCSLPIRTTSICLVEVLYNIKKIWLSDVYMCLNVLSDELNFKSEIKDLPKKKWDLLWAKF